jgi:hypothetical protein
MKGQRRTEQGRKPVADGRKRNEEQDEVKREEGGERVNSGRKQNARGLKRHAKATGTYKKDRGNEKARAENAGNDELHG